MSLIGITEEQLNQKLEQHAGLVAKAILANIQNYLPTATREKRFKISDPTIKENFPSLAMSTLRSWCQGGHIGKMGTDGKYHVTLQEIEKKLYK